LRLKNTLTSCWVEYSITNVGTEPILDVYLTIFFADPTGKLLNVNNTFSGEKIDVGLTIVDRIELPEKVKKSMTVFVTVNRVVTASGVWVVEDADLTSAVKAKLNKRSEEAPSVIFEPNATPSEEDRIRIFELILRDILQDKDKSKMLKDSSTLILLRDSVSFNLPDNLPARLLALNKEEIQALADVEGRIVYLIYEPLRSKGSEVGATIMVRDMYPPPPPRTFRVTFGYAFSFVCVKENGRWIIRNSKGIALSVGNLARLSPAHNYRISTVRTRRRPPAVHPQRTGH
jgi:hypothetical protein